MVLGKWQGGNEKHSYLPTGFKKYLNKYNVIYLDVTLFIFDELPSGHGYADLVFFPKKTSSKPLLLVELKWNKTEAGAIRQLINKDYPPALEGYGGDMLLVEINYDVKSKKHTCRIEALHDVI